MKQQIAIAAAVAALMIGGAFATQSAPREQTDVEVSNPMVSGEAMLADRALMENIAHSPDHTSFAAALRQSGVAKTLAADGDYTVFAPTNAAFAAVKMTADKAQLARAMGYLVVRGRYDSQTLLKDINQGDGQLRLKTIEGGTITAQMNGPTNIVLMDEKGDSADIAVYDVYQKNGVLQVIDKVLQPAQPSQVAGL
ncbi:MAG TPA: fasciclin domain-containing protein [Rhizomicrobium sp.]